MSIASFTDETWPNWCKKRLHELHGMIFFHNGDDSEFVAKKTESRTKLRPHENIRLRPRFLLPYLPLNKVFDGTIHACFASGFRVLGWVFLGEGAEARPDFCTTGPASILRFP